MRFKKKLEEKLEEIRQHILDENSQHKVYRQVELTGLNESVSLLSTESKEDIRFLCSWGLHMLREIKKDDKQDFNK